MDIPRPDNFNETYLYEGEQGSHGHTYPINLSKLGLANDLFPSFIQN